MTDKSHDREPRAWKRWLRKCDPFWIVALSLVLFVVYSFTIYSFAHSDDFLLNYNKPFESAAW
jgi:hypothetical protein